MVGWPHLSGMFPFQGSTDQWLVDPTFLEGFYFKVQQTNGWPSPFWKVSISRFNRPMVDRRFLFHGSTDQWLTDGFYFKVQQTNGWPSPFWKVSISKFNRPMVDPHLSARFLFQGSADQWLTLTFLEGFYFKVQQTNGWPSPFWKVSISRFSRPVVDPHLSWRFLFQGSTDQWLTLTFLQGFYFKVQQTNGWPSTFWKVSVSRFSRPVVDPHLSGRFLFQSSTDQWLTLTSLEGFIF